MLFISEAESAALIGHDLAFRAAKEALIDVCKDTTTFPAVLGHGSEKQNRFSIKASSTSRLAGLKVGSYWPGNQDLGLPRHNSLILLFDQQLGRISVAMEAGIVNAYRTAAVDAVAAYVLARPDSATLAIFGAGNQARFECAAIARVRPIRRILIVARDAARGQALAETLMTADIDARVADAQSACAQADIIVTATAARSPLFQSEWVRDGTHVASMGSDAPGKQELPPELLVRSELFCDLPEQSRRIGEFQHAAPTQPITALGHVLAGTATGRHDPADITVFDSSGLSLQDLVIAQYLLEARREGGA
ncbi:MAG: ornithine cyclodeaminase family protein [Xanthobacteraceae bacterium]